MVSADVIVCHGGSGSIADVLRLGRRPLVVPRRPDLGEHVDDHQITHARLLASTGEIMLAEDRDALEQHLAAALADPASVRVPPATPDIDAAVARFAELVDPLILQPPRRRR
jgi:UDP-N-acetylglucosamine transferase subunit ALG13